MQVSSHNRPCDRNTFLNPKYRIQKKIDYTQRFGEISTVTDPLVSLDSVRDVLYVLTVENFELHSAAEFLLYFGDDRNNVAFFVGKNSTSNPDRAGSF